MLLMQPARTMLPTMHALQTTPLVLGLPTSRTCSCSEGISMGHMTRLVPWALLIIYLGWTKVLLIISPS